MKGGRRLFYVNFRELNRITRTMTTYLQIIDDILESLESATYYVKLDLSTFIGKSNSMWMRMNKVRSLVIEVFFFFILMSCYSGSPTYQYKFILLQSQEECFLIHLDDILAFSDTVCYHF